MSLAWPDDPIVESMASAWPDDPVVEAQQATPWPDDPEDSGQGTGTSMLNAVPRSFVSGIGSTVEGIGDIASLVVGDNLLQAAGKGIKQISADNFAVNPANEDKFAVKAAGVIGQLGEQIAEAATGVSLLKGLGAVKTTAQATKAGRAIALGGAYLKGADSGDDVAKTYGITGDAARAAMILGFGAIEAGTEAIGGIGGAGPLTGGGVKQFLKTAAGEGGEEVLAGIGGDSLTRALAPSGEPGRAANGAVLPNPFDVEKRAEEFALGAVGGGVFGLPHLLGGTPPKAPTTAENPVDPVNPVSPEPAPAGWPNDPVVEPAALPPAPAPAPPPVEPAVEPAPPVDPVEPEVAPVAQQQRQAMAKALSLAASIDPATEQMVGQILTLANNDPATQPAPAAVAPAEIPESPNELPNQPTGGLGGGTAPADSPAGADPVLAPEPLPGFKIHGMLSNGNLSLTADGETLRTQFSKTELTKLLVRRGMSAGLSKEDAKYAATEGAHRIFQEAPVRPRKIRVMSAVLKAWRANPLVTFIMGSTGRMALPADAGLGAPTFNNKGLKSPLHNSIWRKGGEDPWNVAQEAYNEGLIPSPDVNALFKALSEASSGTSENTAESRMEKQGKQAADFSEATQPEAGTTRVNVSELTAGSTVDVEGEKLIVKSIETDEDGYVISVTLLDGEKFGIQTLRGDETIYVESADIKPFEDMEWESENDPEPDAAYQPEFQPPQSKVQAAPLPEDFLSGTAEDPFNLVAETKEEIKSREAAEAKKAAEANAAEVARLKAEAEKQQGNLFEEPSEGTLPPKAKSTMAGVFVDHWRYHVEPALHAFFNAANAFGVERLERNRIKPEGMSLSDWIQKIRAQKPTWNKSQKIGKTGLEMLGQKNLWPTKGPEGESLRKAMLTAVKALNKAPGINGEWISNQEQSETQRSGTNDPQSSTFDDAMNGSDPAFERLDSEKETYHGAPPKGRPGEARGQRFSTPEQFVTAFEAAFAKQDFDAALEAVKAADRSLYAAYMRTLYKAARAGADPTASAKVEWFRLIFNGMFPPGYQPNTPPTQAPPQQQGAPQPQAQQAPPPPPTPKPQPPPPPKPSGKMRFNVAAMIHMATALNANTAINRLMKYARGRASGNRDVNGPARALIELHAHIFKDPVQAAKTLAHEIGHVIDWVFRSLPRSNMAAKVAPLKNYQQIFGHLWDWAGKDMPEINKILQKEAIALSSAWRGPFPRTDRYRNSASELYADFLSAILNDPDYAYKVAPNLTTAFFAGLQQKPAVEAAYNMLIHLLTSDTLLSKLQGEATAAGRVAMRAAVDSSETQAHGKRAFRKAISAVYGALLNRHGILAMKSGGYWTSLKARMAKFGTDYVSKQEHDEQFAHRMTAELEHDLYHLVDKPIEQEGIGHENLATYLKNHRIINEVTSTGKWIEENPDEARELFAWMADASGMLEWIREFEHATNAELYDMGAKFIWKLHEANKFESVMAAGQRVGAPAHVAAALTAFDVSGFMLNPQGITPQTAAEQNRMIEKQLGPVLYARLEQLAAEHHRIIADVMRQAYHLGLISPKLWNDRVEPNLNSYVPFMVLEYFTPKTTAAFFKRHGTAKNIIPAQVASKMKALAMIRRMQWQKIALNLKAFYETEGKTHGFSNEMTVAKDLSPEVKERLEREGGGTIGYWEQGHYQHMLLEDGQVVEAMGSLQLGPLAEPIFGLARKANNFWRMLFTTYNIGFAIRNTIRSFRSLAEATGLRGLSESRQLSKIARDYANAAFGAEWTPEVRDLVTRGVLPAPDRHLAGDLTVDEMTDQILRGAASTDQMSRGLPGTGATSWIRKYLPPLGKLVDGLAYYSAFAESLPKIAAEKAYLAKGMSPAEALALAKLEAIPNPGTRSGKYSQGMDTVLMFYRVATQGMRRSRTLLMNPKTRGGYALRLAISYGLMKSFYVLAGAGLIDALFGGDDDDRQKDFEEWIKRTSPYKFEQDDVLFLGWMDAHGAWHAPFGHSEIPGEWTPLSFRIPSGEEGRHLAPLTATALATMVNSPIRPVDPVQRVGEAIKSSVPGITPTVEVISNWSNIARPVAPQDNYRGRPIVSDDEWNAGYASRLWGMTKYTLASMNVDAAKPDVVANKSLPGWMQAVKSAPVAGTAFNALFASDNYAGVREEQMDRKKRTQASANARLDRGRATVQATRQLQALEQKGKAGRTPTEEIRYQKLKSWDRLYYNGTQKAPGLFKIMKAAESGVPGVDGKAAAERLEETAREVIY